MSDSWHVGKLKYSTCICRGFLMLSSPFRIHPLFLVVCACFPVASHADAQSWGGVAQGGDAMYLARGSVGDDDESVLPLREAGPEAQAIEDDVLPERAAIVAQDGSATKLASGSPPISEQMPRPVDPLAVEDPPPFASTVARGEVVERQEPVLANNLPLKLALGVGAVALSSGLDKSGERFGRQHGDQGAAKAFSRVGNVLPIIALGGAGLAAVASDDPRLSRTGMASLEAGGGAVLTSLGLKYAFGRSRPETGAGPGDFHPFSSNNGNSSMPSIHTAAVWGAVTPFAKEYDMPWLYGIAALTNYARVADRKHWVSDTVAGSLLGYVAGDIAWHWNRSAAGVGSQIYVSPNSIGFSWPLR